METILLTIVIFTGIIVVTYIILYNNIQAFNIKINEAESIIDDLLRKKYDNLDNMKSIILKETDLPEQTLQSHFIISILLYLIQQLRSFHQM